MTGAVSGTPKYAPAAASRAASASGSGRRVNVDAASNDSYGYAHGPMPVDRSIQGCFDPGNSARADSTLPPWARKTSKGEGTAFTKRVPLCCLEAQPRARVRRATRLAVAVHRLVLLIEQILDAGLQLDVRSHRPGEPQIDYLVTLHAARVRVVIEAVAGVRERCAHLNATRQQVVDEHAGSIFGPARQGFAERGAGRAILGVHTAVA